MLQVDWITANQCRSNICMKTVYNIPYRLTIFNVQPASHSKWSCSSALVSLDWSKTHPKHDRTTHTHTCSQCSQCISCSKFCCIGCFFLTQSPIAHLHWVGAVAFSMFFHVFSFSWVVSISMQNTEALVPGLTWAWSQSVTREPFNSVPSLKFFRSTK